MKSIVFRATLEKKQVGSGLRFATALLAVIFALWPLAGNAGAQTAQTLLSGTVMTPSGAPIPNAQVSLTNAKNGMTKSARTKSDGTYQINHLAPARYRLSAASTGFAKTEKTFEIAASADKRVDLVLLQSADPSGAQPPQGVASSSTSAKTVEQLPLNGRSASDVARLEPGVYRAPTQTSHQGRYGFGKQLVIFGGRPRQNSSRLDGVNVSDYANGPLGSAEGTALGVDAIGSLSVLTTNDQARYGRSAGGNVSTSTISGTDALHGGVFEYFRDSVLDAKNYFDQEAKPPFHQNQFGAFLGGPIRKNHTFFFGNYEGFRQSQGMTQVSTLFSAAARAGNLSSGPVTVDSQAKRFLDAFYPVPNGPLLGNGDTAINTFSGQKTSVGDHVTVRVDDRLGTRDSVSAVYIFDRGSVASPNLFSSQKNGWDSRQNFFTVHETHTFSPRLVNSLRFGINRMVADTGLTFPGSNPLEQDTSYGAVPGRYAPFIQIPGISPMAGGLGGFSPYHFRWTSIQMYDDVSFTQGRHQWGFGIAVERMRDNITAISNPNGNFSFQSIADFLTNHPYSFNAPAPGANPEHGFRQTRLGLYVEDNWRWQSNLTLHLGLRYEMTTVPTEVNGHLSTLRNLTDVQPHVGSPLFSNPTLRNFAPRVGFSWDPFRSGKTIVSAGFGIFDVLPLPYEIQHSELFAAPFYKQGSAVNLPMGTFPSGAYTIATSHTSSFQQAYLQPHPKRNYVMHWNLTIERSLPAATTMKIGYVGSRGVHNNFWVGDANIVLPTGTPQGYLWPSPAGSGTRLNPNVGAIPAAFWISDSYYNALIVEATKKIGTSSQVISSYAWGKSIDTSSASISGNEYSNSITNPLWFDTRLNRGPSDFNLTQNLKVVFSYELPSPRGHGTLLDWPLQGWRLGGIFQVTSGVPFTPQIAGDPLGLNNTHPSLDVPNVMSGPGCQSPVNPGDITHYIKTQCLAMPGPTTLLGNLGRNSLVGPSFANLDFSMFKDNSFRAVAREFNLQFRAEFFNVLNHPNFLPPLHNQFVFDSSGNPISSAGFIDHTRGQSREIQLALRLSW